MNFDSLYNFHIQSEILRVKQKSQRNILNAYILKSVCSVHYCHRYSFVIKSSVKSPLIQYYSMYRSVGFFTETNNEQFLLNFPSNLRIHIHIFTYILK